MLLSTKTSAAIADTAHEIRTPWDSCFSSSFDTTATSLISKRRSFQCVSVKSFRRLRRDGAFYRTTDSALKSPLTSHEILVTQPMIRRCEASTLSFVARSKWSLKAIWRSAVNNTSILWMKGRCPRFSYFQSRAQLLHKCHPRSLPAEDEGMVEEESIQAIVEVVTRTVARPIPGHAYIHPFATSDTR
jgi:hypothetical protein